MPRPRLEDWSGSDCPPTRQAMVELQAQGPERDQSWTQPMDGPSLKLGRKTPESDWACPWDTRISRFHATLTWKDGKLRVQRNPSALNPIYCRGQASDDF